LLHVDHNQFGAPALARDIIANMDIKDINTLLIDGDGVLWRAEQPIAGLNDFVEVMNAQGINWALLTNNATRNRMQFVEKFAGFGIEVGVERIFSSAIVTATYLQEHFSAGDTIYVVGEAGLIATLREAGFDVRAGDDQPDEAVAVIGSMDRGLTYGRLAAANRLIRRGARFIQTNPDKTFPMPDGIAPGAGTIMAALVAASGVEPVVIGKPETALYEAAMRAYGAQPERTAMVGDRLETDILGAQRVGISTILVLTGVATRGDLEGGDRAPDLVLDSIADLADMLAARVPG
jgi:4-nitrophenyl phosphatase